MKIPITALLGACVLPALAAAPAGFRFVHQDWEVACDNTRACRAAGYGDGEDAEAPAASVLLTRPAGPHSPVTVALQLDSYNGDRAGAKPGAVTMWVDGRELGQVVIGGDPMKGELNTAQARALLEAVAATGTVQWQDDARTWVLSNHGASAVLLKMDEFQGRLGTPGALLRKGDKAESGVPPPLPMPEVSAQFVAPAEVDLAPPARAALLRELRRALPNDTCDAVAPAALSAQRLTNGKLLVYHACWAGASGQGTAYWVANGAAPFKPVLVTTDGSDHGAGKISATRVMGVCVDARQWVWDGRRYAQTLVANSGMCRTPGFEGLWNLPTYVAKVTRGPR